MCHLRAKPDFAAKLTRGTKKADRREPARRNDACKLRGVRLRRLASCNLGTPRRSRERPSGCADAAPGFFPRVWVSREFFAFLTEDGLNPCMAMDICRGIPPAPSHGSRYFKILPPRRKDRQRSCVNGFMFDQPDASLQDSVSEGRAMMAKCSAKNGKHSPLWVRILRV